MDENKTNSNEIQEQEISEKSKTEQASEAAVIIQGMLNAKGLGKYFELFKEHGILSLAVLEGMTVDDYGRIGVVYENDRKALVKLFKKKSKFLETLITDLIMLAVGIIIITVIILILALILGKSTGFGVGGVLFVILIIVCLLTNL